MGIGGDEGNITLQSHGSDSRFVAKDSCTALKTRPTLRSLDRARCRQHAERQRNVTGPFKPVLIKVSSNGCGLIKSASAGALTLSNESLKKSIMAANKRSHQS